MLLPIQFDILSLTSISVGGVAIDSTLYTFTGRTIYADPSGILIGGMTALYSDLDVLFPRGTKNITVVGVAGWATAPESVKRACIILAENENDPSLYSHYVWGSESMASYSYTSKDRPMTNIREADELLDKYVTRKPKIRA
jgi:hypothetical protein